VTNRILSVRKMLCAAQMAAAMSMLSMVPSLAFAAESAQNPLVGLPDGLAVLRNYTSARVSSEDRKGNADARNIAPGQTLTLADVDGPGEITHLWTTIATADEKHLRNIVFRIYWDGNEFPSVESPVGDFFGLGNAKYYYFSNPVQAIGTDRGMNAFWPMPFAKHARVTATNESETTVGAYYYYVDYRKFDALPENLGYFHAQYRQAKPAEDGKPYLIMEADDAKGHFAGVSLSIHTQVAGWWGEGDDIFTVDGEEKPSLWGTGSEDYFCGAWCYGQPFYTPYFGMPLREKIDQSSNNYWNVYRLHLESPITFKKSLKVEIEHGVNGFENKRSPRNNDYSSCAYWYVDKPQALKGSLPEAKDRIAEFVIPKAPAGVIELHALERKQSPGMEVDVQGMNAFENDQRKWVNGDQLWTPKSVVGGTIDLQLNVKETTEDPVVLLVTLAPDYGKVAVKLDGKKVANYDGYAKDVQAGVLSLSETEFKKGVHTLTFEITGKNPDAKNTLAGFDYIRIGGEPTVAEKEAKKIN
jgi:hypothetical protein